MPVMRDLEKEDAREFALPVQWGDEEEARWVRITRYSNHGNLIEDGGWVACIVLGSLNPWYLGIRGCWRYKYGVRFPTADAAWDAVRRSFSITASIDKERAEVSE